MTDVDTQYKAIKTGIGAAWLRREVIRVTGDDAANYLQGQLSQDLDKVEIGDSTWSWLLQPHGKVDAFLRVTRVGAQEFIIDFDAGFGDLVSERLDRFKMRTKVTFEPLKWKVLGVRGAKAAADADGDVVAQLNWPNWSGVDVLGESPAVPEGATLCDFDVYEAARIEAGFPVLGAELDQLTIPAEAGINDRTISFTKGCYTGQELVARIDARGGNVPRHLRGIVIDTPDVPARGAKVVLANPAPGAKPLGSLTSAAFSPGFGKVVGLAYIRREVMIPATALVETDDGAKECRIETLPLENHPLEP
jgi:tRNA-modifying protein YgfZ